MTDKNEIRFIGDMQRLKMEPGDMFVLSSDRPLTREMVNGLRAEWDRQVGAAHKLLILDSGLKLGIVGSNEIKSD